MSQTVITQAFEALKAQEAANGGIVTLDEFVFARVPDLNITDPIDRTEGLPPEAQIVHRQAVSRTGMVNSNAVVYSVVLGADVGDFEFNWVGLLNKDNGVVAMIVHAPSQKKIRTQSGQQGNVLTRSFLMEYNGASQQTQIITPADTWQIDFTARLNGVDERIRRENIDAYGTASFLKDGFLVSGANGSYQVKKGVAYIEGLRAELLFDQAISVAERPSRIWVDVCWRGTLTSVWASATKLTVADSLENYVIGDEHHYVFAIADILADGSVVDLRQASAMAQLVGLSAEANVIPYFDNDSRLAKSAISDFTRQMLANPDAQGVLRNLGLNTCLSVAVLRATEPVSNGQRMVVTSYHDGWAAVAGGEPKYGGEFWHDATDATTPDDGFKCFVTVGGKRWKRVKGIYGVGHAGAVEDEGIDSTERIQAAINGTKSGQELRFDGGPYNFDAVILSKAIVLAGDASIKHNGFRIKASHITSRLSGKQTCRNYQITTRAFECRANEDGADYEDIQILHNRFEGFFYATAFVARDYSLINDPGARVVKNTKIIGCTSVAPLVGNAGHFQHIGITNSEASHNSTYGGQGATSYNFINQNGYVRIIGNYDENNSYGSCELENSTVSNSVISGNTFGSDLWVDDTSNVSIVGNTTASVLRVTAETTDVYNLTITGNTAKRFRIEQFGDAPVGWVYDTVLVGNTATGADAGGADYFLGALVTGEVASNSCNGSSTHIGITRRASTNLTVRNNRGKGGILLIGSAGGRVVEYGNDNMVVSGVSDSPHVSKMMITHSAYLDLPGKYLHGTKITGSVAPGAAASIALPIPVSTDPTFRGVALWVLIRDAATGNMSSFRIDGRYVYFGSVQLVFGAPYSTQGTDAGSITIGNNGSTTASINVLVTNTSGSKTLQVTVMPEVSSRLGIEE